MNNLKTYIDKPALLAIALTLPLVYYISASLLEILGSKMLTDLLKASGWGDTLFLVMNVCVILSLMVCFSNLVYMNFSKIHKNTPDIRAKSLFNLFIFAVNIGGVVFVYVYILATFPQIPVGQG